jgi:hypothetical protein
MRAGTTTLLCATRLVTATDGIMIKKLLLTSVAALFLATGAAHATDTEYKCGPDTTVYVSRETLHIVHEPGEEATVVIKVQRGYSTKRYPIVRYDVEKDKLTVNGKPCKEPKDILKEAPSYYARQIMRKGSRTWTKEEPARQKA